MGGKAFGELNIVRMDKENYDIISNNIVDLLKRILKSDNVGALSYYKEKSSFGDVDVIITNEDIHRFEIENNVNFYNFVQEKINSPRISDNTSLVSLAFKINSKDYVQIDLMPHPEKDYVNVHRYFSYNDLCILIGRFLSVPVFNARYTKEGCEINIYREENNTEYLLGIARTENKIYDYLTFLDLNVEKFKSGFSSKKEIYKFIYDSKYFDYNNFLNAINIDNSLEKVRQSRDLYQGFIDFILTQKEKKGVKPKNAKECLLNNFPELKIQEDNYKKEYSDFLLFKDKFNGDNISKLLKIDKKDRNLGVIMKSFLKHRVLSENKEFINKVLLLSESEFFNMLLSAKNKYYDKNLNIKKTKRGM